jgi:hypothetical protein
VHEYGVCEEAILGELPHAQANQGLSTEGELTNVRNEKWGQPRIVMPRLLDPVVSVVLVES